MSMFNNRTDTERELEEFHKRNQGQAGDDYQNQSFDMQSADNYTDTTENRKLKLEKQSADIYSAENASFDGNIQGEKLKSTSVVSKTTIWIIISLVLSAVLLPINHYIALFCLGQLLFALDSVLSSTRKIPSLVKPLFGLLSYFGACMLFYSTVHFFNGGHRSKNDRGHTIHSLLLWSFLVCIITENDSNSNRNLFPKETLYCKNCS